MPLPLDMQYDSINCQVASDFYFCKKIKSKSFISYANVQVFIFWNILHKFV